MANAKTLLWVGVGISLLGSASVAHGACLSSTAEAREQRSDIVFEGVAIDGPYSPATFRVSRYLKGGGPELVRIKTGEINLPNGEGVGTSDMPTPSPGETWLIYTQGVVDGVLQTRPCDGSRRLLSAASAASTADRPRQPLQLISSRHQEGVLPPFALVASFFRSSQS